jgi:sialic acid synthase SpsE
MIQIVAEIAQGYEGKAEIAEMLIKASKLAGADAVKMQLVYADELCTSDYKDFKLFKQLEMSDSQWMALSNITKELDIKFYLDIFGSKSLSLSEKIKVDGIKIHSTDMGNVGLLEMVGNSSINKVFLSAGGAYFDEITKAVNMLKNKHIVLLLGFQGYPTQVYENQICRVNFLKNFYKNSSNVTIGFADHASPDSMQSISIAAIAIGAGASFIEKHLTLSSVLKMEDYESALNPDQFQIFCKELKACDEAYGECSENNNFGMSESEIKYRNWTRKHVVSKREVKSGSIIGADDLVLKRTSSKNATYELNAVYGKRAIVDIEPNSPILPDMIQAN